MSQLAQERAAELIEAFEWLDNWEDRYGYLIDLGRKLPPMPESEKTEENRILGCQSRVWVSARAAEGRVVFDADSDAAISKGLVAILWHVFSGQSAAEILAFDVEALLQSLQLDEHLSMNRRNGLFSMIQRIRSLAALQNG